jgi:hypothetical protein
LKILLDEGVPHPLALKLPGHDVRTVAGQGWLAVKNGRLLALIESEGFQVFVTGDKNLQHQQSLLGRPFRTLILSAISWPVIRRHLPAIAEAVDHSAPGTILLVDCGVFVPTRKRREK